MDTGLMVLLFIVAFVGTIVMMVIYPDLFFPGRVKRTRGQRGGVFHPQSAAPAPASNPPAAKVETHPPQPAQPLVLRAWLDLVNNRPDEAPHLFIEVANSLRMSDRLQSL